VTWHLVTGEYPPECGGVGDYSADLARALADSGDTVHVWTTGRREAWSAETPPVAHDSRIAVHDLPDAFGPRSRAALEAAWRQTPGIVLLQYVPNALGARGANLRFCRWLRRVHRDGADVRIMFHEPYFYFTLARPWRNALAIVQRTMAATLLQAADTIYMSTETWSRYLQAVGALPRVETLPIPSSIPDGAAADVIAQQRARIAPAGTAIVGHFGTYGDHVGGALLARLPAIVEQAPVAHFAFMGAGSREFLERLRERHPQIASRSWASGRLPAADLPAVLRACDLLIQPYPDGITTRRTSAMAGLKNAVATVSTSGALTEPIWNETGAVALAPVRDATAFARTVARLLDDPAARHLQAAAGARAYERHFSMPRTVALLRAAPVGAA
jgi:glycosyltransferase involved in cell wall biosynthesis